MARPELTDDQIEKKFFKKKDVPVAPLDDATVDQSAIGTAMAQMRADETATALVIAQHNERVTALARELNYQGSTDLSVLENSARDAIRRIGMGIFELGGYLLLIKEGSAHGEFAQVLERLEINQSSSNKYMAITRRFANSPLTANLEKLGVTKMVELLPLDDDQVDDLVEEGQTGELALDDVGRMSVKELRAAVRRERAEGAKQKGRAERQEAVNAELHEEARLIKQLPAPDAIKRILQEAAGIQADTMGRVRGSLRQALEALNGCGEDQSLVMGGMVGQLLAELIALRDEFNLPEISATPAWEQWAEGQGNVTQVN